MVAECAFIPDDHVIKALAPNGADESFDERIVESLGVAAGGCLCRNGLQGRASRSDRAELPAYFAGSRLACFFR